MIKYLFSRFLVIFIAKFFIDWAFNIKGQFVQFFECYDETALQIINVILFPIIISTGIITLNVIFTFWHLKNSEFGNNENLEDKEKIKKYLLICVNPFSKIFWSFFGKNFNIETEKEKYGGIFIAFVFFLFPLIKGNPLLNNYYGIHKEYEYETLRSSSTAISEEKYYIFPKKNVKREMNSLENTMEDDEFFDVGKRGYLFIQAGLIDGYQSYKDNYHGFFAYLGCIPFAIIEKLIYTIMYFLIPFILCIIIRVRYF